MLDILKKEDAEQQRCVGGRLEAKGDKGCGEKRTSTEDVHLDKRRDMAGLSDSLCRQGLTWSRVRRSGIPERRAGRKGRPACLMSSPIGDCRRSTPALITIRSSRPSCRTS